MIRLVLLLLSASVVMAQGPQLIEGDLEGTPITFRISEGLAIFQDDIILGPATKPSGRRNTSFFIGNLWPGGLIPYEIDPTFPATTLAQLQQAIVTWNGYGTPIHLQPRSGDTDYVRFTRSTATTGVCSSAVGRRGGAQSVILEDGCTAPPIIHEIGHTVGMWHEQSRIDRNFNVTVLYENIAKTLASNYAIEPSGQDLAGYEYSSSMHYRPFSFSVDGKQAIESVPPGIPMGEASGMNAGDLDAVNRKYGRIPAQTTIASNPPGLIVEVDGQPVTTPRIFAWTPGSQHVVTAPAAPQVVSGLQYVHGKWSDGGPQSHTINSNADVTVYTANFIRRAPVNLVQQLGGTASVSPPSPDGFYSAYTQIKLTAVPADGYRFHRWLSFGSSCNGNTTSANPLILPPSAGIASCAPQFTQSAITTIDSDPPGQLVTVDGIRYAAPINFTFISGSQHTIGASSPAQGFASRLLFSSWSDGGEATHSYTALPDGGVVTARFTKQFLLTVGQPPAQTGSILVSPASLDGFYTEGTAVSIQANLNPVLSLFSWTGDLTGRTNPTTLVMDDQHLVGATATAVQHPVTVLNSLTFQATAVSPGEIVSIFGSDLGPPAGAGPVINAAGLVDSASGGTRILFDGVPAPVLYASPGQVNVVVPYGVVPGTITRLVAEYRGSQKPSEALSVVSLAPSIVSNGAGRAVIVNQDGSFNTASRPAKRGSVIVFFATGEGTTTPGGVDGRVGVAPLAKPNLAVSVRIGGKVAELLYAGNAPNFVAGAMQVNARIPDDAPTGDVSIYLVVGTAASPPITKLSVE